MFFDSLSELARIAERVSCGVFVLTDPSTELPLKNPRYLRPQNGKKSIGVEEVRDFTASTHARQNSSQFLVINPADALSEEAGNALLKNLEEPGAHYHYLLITKHPGRLLPTILSRAEVFYERQTDPLNQPVKANPKIAALARNLIKATPAELPALAEQISKIKDNPRGHALEIAATAIEILEKSYLKTGQPVFLKKLSGFLKLHQSLSGNGHVKLHIVADLC